MISTTFMEELAQYSDSDDEQLVVPQILPSCPCPASAAAGSADSSAVQSCDVAAASGSSLSSSTAAAGTIPLSKGPSSFAAVRFKCPGCPKTYANTGGVIKHINTVSDPESCSFDGEHPKVTCAITASATKVNCMLSAEGLWVIQQPPKVSVPGVSWREVMGYHHSSASVSKATCGDALAHCSINFYCKFDGLTGEFLAKADQLLQLSVPAVFNSVHFKMWKAAVSAFFTEANGKIPNATVSEVSCLQYVRSLFRCSHH